MLRYLMIVGSLAVFLAANPVDAGHLAGGHAQFDPCQVQYVEKTVYRPQWVTETRTVMVTQYVHEQREGTRTVYHCVPEQYEVQRSCTVMVAEVRTKTVPVTHCKPVYRQVERQYAVQVPHWIQQEQQYTVMVPQVQTRQGVRKVCKWVEEQVTKTVQRDHGHWEVQMVQAPRYSGRRCCLRRRGCDPRCVSVRTVSQRVWAPNLVEEEVTLTVCRPKIVEEPYEYQVMVCKPETRTRLVNVCQMKTEIRTKMFTVVEYETVTTERQVSYTVYVPQQRTWTETMTRYRQVVEEVPYTYTVWVPRQVEREVQVQVCQMVAETVKVPACPVICCRPVHRRLRRL